jgi:hypothetical protein
MLVEITAGLAGLAVVVSGLDLLVNMRAQKDMAQLENKILTGINGKYISRKEADLLDREREKQEKAASSEFENIHKKIEETRHQHHVLHEEFIACRASSRVQGG